jgi:spore germination cell wall hydrolase CwlJ-like protein
MTLIALGTCVHQRGTVAKPVTGAPGLASPRTPAPPTVEPLLLQPLKPEEAILANAARPVDGGAGPAAQPLSIGRHAPPYRTALECLTSAIYYEAASEPLDGQRAVAQVVLNRVQHPAFPSSVCAVVYQGAERRTGCQFSFTCDGSLLRAPAKPHWTAARVVAEAALSGAVHRSVGNATHYHADWVLPYWASSLNKTAVIGRHIFYRWKGFWGEPSAFRQRYAGAEKKPNVDDKLSVLAPSTDALVKKKLPAPGDLLGETTEKRQIAPEHRPMQLDNEPLPTLVADSTVGKFIGNFGTGRALGEPRAPSRAEVSAAKPDVPSNCAPAAQARPIGTAMAKIEASPALSRRC